MLKNIEVDVAVKMLTGLPVTRETEPIVLAEAQGRILSEDVKARMSVPPFDRSPYDGYAFKGEDTKAACAEHPITLQITEEIPAGKAPSIKITTGHAAKILTGAPIPDGADATIKYEETEYSDSDVKIFAPVAPDTNVVRAGDDILAGTVIFTKGTCITAPMLGVLASQGYDKIPVYKKPVIMILNTGTELVEVGQPLPEAAIYNSNVYTLSGYLRDQGAEAKNAGVVEDDPDVIARRIGQALDASDMVITTGGASVGDYDWAVTSAETLGAEVLFWKTKMKPGGSLMAAVKDGKLILGLSGNPGAAVLGLIRIALPYIRKLCGYEELELDTVQVQLRQSFDKESPKLRILRGRLEIQDGKAYFAENEGQGNGAVFSLVGCDLLGEIKPGASPLPAGAVIKAYRV